jgi:DNA mismatch endonuclease (patch repair protein)
MTSASTAKQPTLKAMDEATSRRMARTRGRDNGIERALRSALHRKGIRFRLHYPVPSVPRRSIDIALPARRVAIFVDGCFWHGCREHGTWPTRNAQFWREKIEANTRRDQSTDKALKNAGWCVVRVWEHDDADEAVRRIIQVISV